jgi:hypothetical protein
MTGSVATGSSGTNGVGPTGPGADGPGMRCHGGDDADRRPGTAAARPVRRRHPAPPFCIVGLDGSLADPVGRTDARWMDAERAFLVDLCDGEASESNVVELVDQVQQTWMIEQPDPAPLVGLFGVAVGDLIIARIPGFRWCQVHDDERNELGLTHVDSPVVVFPLAATAQYWQARGLGWLPDYLDRVEESVTRLAQAS